VQEKEHWFLAIIHLYSFIIVCNCCPFSNGTVQLIRYLLHHRLQLSDENEKKSQYPTFNLGLCLSSQIRRSHFETQAVAQKHGSNSIGTRHLLPSPITTSFVINIYLDLPGYCYCLLIINLLPPNLVYSRSARFSAFDSFFGGPNLLASCN